MLGINVMKYMLVLSLVGKSTSSTLIFIEASPPESATHFEATEVERATHVVWRLTTVVIHGYLQGSYKRFDFLQVHQHC
jgi:hypothetical protein